VAREIVPVQYPALGSFFSKRQMHSSHSRLNKIGESPHILNKISIAENHENSLSSFPSHSVWTNGQEDLVKVFK
jgi:hypothetical protein